ncbi:NAD-dependent succinate-semialdehyde dehydrogenase [Ottowia thiooxydans]|uniref:NAD-dependent succinate-semialdehyde dehydrogenase n=1 Tax=Ottowia thiooxydans TaxID=219182 RepID=UPI000429E66D|nr:NAD-dependent succinate-semialdehyde dehydrogenase [Ottowia thiooxydans]
MLYPQLRQLIAGEWREGRGDDVRAVVNPATEEQLGEFRHASDDDVDRAVAGAEQAFAVWRARSPEQRQIDLHRVAALIRERVDRISHLLSSEGGKPLHDARREVLRSATIIEWDAAEGRRLYGRVIPAEPGMHLEAMREPAGVVAALIAWNFPVGFMARKVGGALAAGCAVVLKSTEETPGTCVAYLECFVDAGLPPGLVSLLIGDPTRIAPRLISASAVRVVSFTGSTGVGKTLGQLCAEHIKRSVLELGGHAPVLVCEDADIEKAVKALIGAKFLNNAGQVCVAPTRMFVARPRYAEFCEALAQAARGLRVGPSNEDGVQMGPLIHERRRTAIESLVQDALSCGAKLLAGGTRIGTRGFFYAPTVLGDVPPQARAMNEEPFGPLALIAPFDTLEEGLQRANSLGYGLAAYAFTESARSARLIAERIEAGMLSINHCTAAPPGAPFGGVKDSGHGREGGPEGLLEFTSTKFVSHKIY